MKSAWIFAAALAAGAGMAAAQDAAAPAEAPAEAPAAAANTDAAPADDCKVREYAMALRWQQSSGEAAALQIQAYTLAKLRLDEALAAGGDEKLAVVADLDETVIDNSPLIARDVVECHDFTGWDTWLDWERNGNPTLIPGAKDFFDYADSKDVAIYYVSDRYDQNKDATLKTLTGLGLPQVADDHVLLLGPPKAERFASVAKDHRIVMFLGDTVTDFSGDFADLDYAGRKKMIEDNANKVGTEWIVLPNPTYGSFRKADLNTWDAPIVVEPAP